MKLLRRLDQLATDILVAGAELLACLIVQFFLGAYRNKKPSGYGRTR